MTGIPEGYLRQHQYDALRKMSNGKVLFGDVGTGKSRVAAAYYLENEAPKDVYVITTARKRNELDWEKEFAKLDIGNRSGPLGPNRGHPKKNRGKVSGAGAVAVAEVPDEERSHADGGLGDLQKGKHDLSDNAGSAVEMDGSKREKPRGDREGAGSRRYSERDTYDVVERNTESTSRASMVQSENPNLGGGGLSVNTGSFPWVLTVDSWNNIAKYADVSGAFFIFDEQRLVGSGAWVKKFLRIAKRNNWILLTGTPGDTWMDYFPLFIANGLYKNRSECIREHVVYNSFTKFPKVDRYVNVGRLARHRSNILVKMPFVRHTERRTVWTPLLYDKDTLDLVLTKRWNIYEERPCRDIAELFTVARRVVNSDPSRLEMVCQLWEEHPKLIVFYNYNFELESLRSLKEYYGISNNGNGTRTRTGTVGSGDTISTQICFAGSLLTETTLTGKSAVMKEKALKEQRATFGSTHGMTASGGAIPGLVPTDRLPKKTSSGISRPLPEQTSDSINPTEGLVLHRNQDPTIAKKHGIDTGHGLPVHQQKPEETVAIAEWNGHKHELVPTTDRWLYLVQYTAGAEAWNCTETDAMAMYSLNYSWRTMEQAYGRIDRLNTPFDVLRYYLFTTDSFVDKAIERSLAAKEDFNYAKYLGLFHDAA